MSYSNYQLNTLFQNLLSRVNALSPPVGSFVPIDGNTTINDVKTFTQAPETQAVATQPYEIPNLETVQALIGGGNILNSDNTFTGLNDFIQTPTTEGTATQPTDITNLQTVQALIGGGGSIPNLNQVLTQGASGGNKNINDINTLQVSTINNNPNSIPYNNDINIDNENGQVIINSQNLNLKFAYAGELLLNNIAGAEGQVITSSDLGTPYWATPTGGNQNLSQVLTVGNDATNQDINNVNNLTVSHITSNYDLSHDLRISNNLGQIIIDYGVLNLNATSPYSLLQINGINATEGQIIISDANGRPYWGNQSVGQPQNIEQVLITGNDANNQDINNVGLITTSNIQNNGYYKDSLGSIGTFGQILSSNGVSTEWISPLNPLYASLDGVNVFTGNNRFTKPLIISNLSISTTPYSFNFSTFSGRSLPITTLIGDYYIPLFTAGGKASKILTGISTAGTQQVVLGNINTFTNENYFNQALTVDSLIFNDQNSFFASTSITNTNNFIRIIIDNTPYFIELFTLNNSSRTHAPPLTFPQEQGINTGLATLGGDNLFDGSNTMLSTLTVSSLVFTSPSIATPILSSNNLFLNISVNGVSYYIQLFYF